MSNYQCPRKEKDCLGYWKFCNLHWKLFGPMSKGRLPGTDFVIRYSLFDIQYSIRNLAAAEGLRWEGVEVWLDWRCVGVPR